MEPAEIVGYVATAFTIVAFMPQVWRVWKMRETRDISLSAFILLFCGAVSWTTYGVLLGAWPIILTNVIIGILQLMIIGFKLKYG